MNTVLEFFTANATGLGVILALLAQFFPKKTLVSKIARTIASHPELTKEVKKAVDDYNTLNK